MTNPISSSSTTAPAYSYIPISNNDAVDASLSASTAAWIRHCTTITQDGLRFDGRTNPQCRPVPRTTLSRTAQGTATATVQWGSATASSASTRVWATCAGTLGPPTEARPHEGVVNMSVELSPAASTQFRQAAAVTNQPRTSAGTSSSNSHMDASQKWMTNRLLRAVERLLATCLDAEALVVTPGQWVWHIHVSAVVLDAAGGNIGDAVWYAVVAAVQHYRQPQTVLPSSLSSSQIHHNNADHNPLAPPPTLLSLDAKEGTPLPLHQIPLAVSFCAMASSSHPSLGSDATAVAATNNNKLAWLVDPSQVEELLAVGHVTYAMNVHKEICWVDFGLTQGGSGGPQLLPNELTTAVALPQVQRLATALQEALTQADAKAVEERLALLKQTQQPSSNRNDDDLMQDDELPPLPTGDLPEPPSSHDNKQQQEDELYRTQALDYNVGHVAQPLAREDDAPNKKVATKKPPSALLATLLQQATASPEVTTAATASTILNPTDTGPKASATQPSTAASVTAMDDDDDEEETTMQLQSEFANVVVPPPKPRAPAPIDDDEVDDLAAAIKTKKKKKRSKK